ncbi:OOP family OmpA-OmpF porin [Bibersteinia trehalosi]|uniref:Outer membrane protein A n=1 Tax=Bibersteinia trehalosi TaxID=47735 RepID=Q6PSJ7_BIBTR|nr:porin OmpA [Bibersteinia trehalosi]AAS91729.1 OmpA [Bibersteinia trehalosi]TCT14506.1 OOP family OmpA-OmpF porin [Bibersteinia trehalosi]
MKKSLVALAVAGFAVASANAAPEANSFYVGAKAGWATFHNDVNQFNSKYALDERYAGGPTAYGINRNSVTYGVFGGYQIIDNLAVELGYDYFGRVRGNVQVDEQDSKAVKHTAHGTHLSLKPSYEVVSGLDVYGKVGAALVRNDYKNYVDQEKSHNLKTSLLLGAGLEYAITPALAARLEYQWLSNVGNFNKAESKENRLRNVTYRPDIHSVSAGLVYRFGQGAAPVAAPEIVSKNFAFSSDVLFDFGKANLKPAAAASLDAAHAEIQNLGLAAPAIQVNGYTDRIGKDAPNLALSQRRAESVANYMVSKGVAPESITAVGYGKANPVTGNTCDAVKGRKALIACLAPDRRVELQVQGSKEVAM